MMSKYQLTPNELFVIRYILTFCEGYTENFLGMFLAIPCCRELMYDTLVSLQNKGIILKSYKVPVKGEVFSPQCVPFNTNFVKFLNKSSYEMFEELLSVYPKFTFIDGFQVSIDGISKKFDSPEHAARYYGKIIHWNPDTHKYILELLEWAKNNTNFINFSLATFLIDRKWNAIEAIKDGDNSNINYNSFRSI